MAIRVSASVLASDLSRLGDEIKRAEKAGCDLIHIDVMDGAFVPNVTYGNVIQQAVRGVTALPFDTHLMVANPTRMIPLFKKAGSDIITIHLESDGDTAENLRLIRSLGMKSGLSIKPGTPAEAVFPYLPLADMILVMTVEPGEGGQGFIPESPEKIRIIRDEAKKRGITPRIEVDGGINPQTAPLVIAAGSEILVAGTSIFKAGNMADAVSAIKG